ncbi:recombinase family protein [Marinactinospora rubrisoli]|uniref:Recombinase family protein n=1 Tax=Marinactinospora rubrisoli TaxID=2715399 RepID=A0ABW2KNI0_9ACTN
MSAELELLKRMRGPRPRMLAYLRVSTDKRDKRSVNQQEAGARRTADHEGWDLAGVYVDNDRSASEYATQEREDWKRLMADIEAGAGEVVWGWEIARWTRERDVWAALVSAAKKQGMFFHVGGKLYDTQNGQDMFFLDIMLAKSVAEVEDTRRRILRDVSSNAESGSPHGVAGYGFERIYHPKTGNLVRQVVRQEEAKIVREIAERYLAGETMKSIASDLNRRGIPNASGHVAGEPVPHPKTKKLHPAMGWSSMVIRQLLLRPALMGKRIHRGQIISEGGWEPILDEGMWWAIQARLAQNQSSSDTTAQYLLSGIAICGVCGARMYKIQRSGKGRKAVYCCRGLYPGAPIGCVSRSLEALDSHVEEGVIERFSDPDVLTAFTSEAVSPEQVKAAHAQLTQMRAELDALYDDVRADRVSRMMAQADEERIKRKIAEAEKLARPRAIEPLAVALAAPDDPDLVERTWRGWTLEQQRAGLRAFTKWIKVLRVGRTGPRKLSAEESVAIKWVGEG